jgi:hypothetical protein
LATLPCRSADLSAEKAVAHVVVVCDCGVVEVISHQLVHTLDLL